MKSFNKYLNIANIFESTTLLLLATLLINIVAMYPIGERGIVCIMVIILFTNFVSGIINIVKKHIAIGIISIILAIIPLTILALYYITALYFDLDLLMNISMIILIILSIINLILNKKIEEQKHSKIPLILFSIITLASLMLTITPLIQYSADTQAFEKALPAIESDNYEKTYIIEEDDNNVIFMDEKLNNTISKEKFEWVQQTIYDYTINNKAVRFYCAKTQNKSAIINTKGEILLKINTENVEEFVKKMASKSKYNISREMEPWPTSPNDFNKLTKYLETNKQYEDNSNYKYMYFKNNESASNKILQVAITTDLERDLELADAIKETRESEEDFIENFYKYKREYYIIDTNSNTKKKLDCNNLIYEAIDNVNTIQESILLFTNENIPFYDSNETGYFDWEGNKVRLNKPYLVYDCIDKYAVVYDKSAYKTFLISLKTGEVEKEFQGNAIKYKNFYILKPYSYLGNYIVLDKEFNKIAESNREPHIVDENVVSVSTKENINYVYMYENGKLTEKYKSQSKRFLIQSTMPLYTSSSNIYENLELNKE